MIKNLLLSLIWLYQRLISPWLGPSCRFFPSCSEYVALSIIQFGVWKGASRGVKRLLLCHPFHPGGVDFPLDK